MREKFVPDIVGHDEAIKRDAERWRRAEEHIKSERAHLQSERTSCEGQDALLDDCYREGQLDALTALLVATTKARVSDG